MPRFNSDLIEWMNASPSSKIINANLKVTKTDTESTVIAYLVHTAILLFSTRPKWMETEVSVQIGR